MHGQVATPHGSNSAYRAITVTRCSPRIRDRQYRPDAAADRARTVRIQAGVHREMVMFFRDQKISFEDQVRLAEYFGSAATTPARRHSKESQDPRVRSSISTRSAEISGNAFHTDSPGGGPAARQHPLHSHHTAERRWRHHVRQHVRSLRWAVGADEALSRRAHSAARRRDAVRRRAPAHRAPVVVRHPESGRKGLYFNAGACAGSTASRAAEGISLARFLVRTLPAARIPVPLPLEATFNRILGQPLLPHYATTDYWPHTRSGYRVQIEGWRRRQRLEPERSERTRTCSGHQKLVCAAR